jgi:hypothetical protein
MGEPMELPENPLAPRTATYEQAFPELEQAPLIQCYESDACS